MSGIWRSLFGRLVWPFLQLNSDPRDAGLLRSLIARLSKAAVRRLNLILHLSDANLRPGTAWKWNSDHGGPNYGDNFPGGGERIDSYSPISLTHIWIQESSDNPREVIPTTTQYINATGKQTLTLLQTAAPFIPVPLIKEAVDVAFKIIEVCEVCKISPMKCCKIVNNILLLPEYIRRRWKGQRVERPGIQSVEGYIRNFYTQRWKRQWRGYREGGEGYWAGYQGPSQVACSDIEDDHWLLTMSITALWRRSTRTWMKLLRKADGS